MKSIENKGAMVFGGGDYPNQLEQVEACTKRIPPILSELIAPYFKTYCLFIEDNFDPDAACQTSPLRVSTNMP
ncbi:MAG: hypothetical protein IIB40_07715 [Candidatus Marinimicrobia bacterium]|nr:hypothetical protein [Candidatus Neomarinimicrobiota bacterium]